MAANIVQYFSRTLPEQPDYFADFERPVLSYVVDSLGPHLRESPSSAELRIKVGMLQCLLENGCDPNAVYYDPVKSQHRERTPWDDFVTCAKLFGDSQRQAPAPENSSRRAILEDLSSLMLQHGADPSLWPSSVDIAQSFPYITAQKRSRPQDDFEPRGQIPKRLRGLQGSHTTTPLGQNGRLVQADPGLHLRSQSPSATQNDLGNYVHVQPSFFSRQDQFEL